MTESGTDSDYTPEWDISDDEGDSRPRKVLGPSRLGQCSDQDVVTDVNPQQTQRGQHTMLPPQTASNQRPFVAATAPGQLQTQNGKGSILHGSNNFRHKQLATAHQGPSSNGSSHDVVQNTATQLGAHPSAQGPVQKPRLLKPPPLVRPPTGPTRRSSSSGGAVHLSTVHQAAAAATLASSSPHVASQTAAYPRTCTTATQGDVAAGPVPPIDHQKTTLAARPPLDTDLQQVPCSAWMQQQQQPLQVNPMAAAHHSGVDAPVNLQAAMEGWGDSSTGQVFDGQQPPPAAAAVADSVTAPVSSLAAPAAPNPPRGATGPWASDGKAWVCAAADGRDTMMHGSSSSTKGPRPGLQPSPAKQLEQQGDNKAQQGQLVLAHQHLQDSSLPSAMPFLPASELHAAGAGVCAAGPAAVDGAGNAYDLHAAFGSAEYVEALDEVDNTHVQQNVQQHDFDRPFVAQHHQYQQEFATSAPLQHQEQQQGAADPSHTSGHGSGGIWAAAQQQQPPGRYGPAADELGTGISGGCGAAEGAVLGQQLQPAAAPIVQQMAGAPGAMFSADLDSSQALLHVQPTPCLPPPQQQSDAQLFQEQLSSSTKEHQQQQEATAAEGMQDTHAATPHNQQQYVCTSIPLFADTADAGSSPACPAAAVAAGLTVAATEQSGQQGAEHADHGQQQHSWQHTPGGYTAASGPLFGATSSEFAVGTQPADNPAAASTNQHNSAESPSEWLENMGDTAEMGDTADAPPPGESAVAAAAAGLGTVDNGTFGTGSGTATASVPTSAWPPGWFDDADGAAGADNDGGFFDGLSQPEPQQTAAAPPSSTPALPSVPAAGHVDRTGAAARADDTIAAGAAPPHHDSSQPWQQEVQWDTQQHWQQHTLQHPQQQEQQHQWSASQGWEQHHQPSQHGWAGADVYQQAAGPGGYSSYEQLPTANQAPQQPHQQPEPQQHWMAGPQPSESTVVTAPTDPAGQQGTPGFHGATTAAAPAGVSTAHACASTAADNAYAAADDGADFFNSLSASSPEGSAQLTAAARTAAVQEPEAAPCAAVPAAAAAPYGGMVGATADVMEVAAGELPAAAAAAADNHPQAPHAMPGAPYHHHQQQQQQPAYHEGHPHQGQQQQQWDNTDQNTWYPNQQVSYQQQQQQYVADHDQVPMDAQQQVQQYAWGTEQYQQQQQSWDTPVGWATQHSSQQSHAGQQYGHTNSQHYSHYPTTAWDHHQQAQQSYAPPAGAGVGVAVELTQEQQQHAFGGLGVARPLRRTSAASGSGLRKMSSPGLPSALIPSATGISPTAGHWVPSGSLGLQQQQHFQAVGGTGGTDSQSDSPAAAVTVGTQYQTLTTYGSSGGRASTLLPAPPVISPPGVYTPGVGTGSALSSGGHYQQQYAGQTAARGGSAELKMFAPVCSANSLGGAGNTAAALGNLGGFYGGPGLAQQQHLYNPVGAVNPAVPQFVMPDERTLAAYAAAAPPLNFEEARRSPHGRPACCLVVLGVGGRCALQQPSLHSGMDVSFATMGAGCVHLLPLPQLLTTLKSVCPAAEAYSAPADSYAPVGSISRGNGNGTGTGADPLSSSNVLSLTAFNRFLDSFPGPLSASSSKEKVVKWLKDRLASCVEEECLTEAPTWQVDCRKNIWELLLLMAKHQGQLKVSYSNSSKATGLLRGAVTAAAGAAISAATGTTPPAGAGTPQGEAGSKAGSQSGTPKAGAGQPAGVADPCNDSELLKILTPELSSAVGPSSGLPVLSKQAPETDMQATAAEMQRLLLMGRRHEALDVALAGQLWGPALVLAHGYGEAKFAEVAGNMAHQGLQRGTPLRTLSLLLANRQDLIFEASLAAAAAPGGITSPMAGPGPTPPGFKPSPGYSTQGSAGLKPSGGSLIGSSLVPSGGSGAAAGGGSLFSPTGGSGSWGLFSPSAGPQRDNLLMHWRENLAIMAANRTAAGVDAMTQLGDLLLAQTGQLDAAHVCYLLAGVTPAAMDAGPAARMLLLGVNHRSVGGQRAMRHLLPLMRAEVYEWARSLAGDTPQMWLALLPYKLQLAANLADFGQVPQALQYCNVMEATLRATAQQTSTATGSALPGIPPSLVLLASQLEALRDRLSIHAAAHNIKVASNESTLGKLGRFLDKTISNLMWGGDLPAPGPPAVSPTVAGQQPPATALTSAASLNATASQGVAAVTAAGPGQQTMHRKGSWFGRTTPVSAPTAPATSDAPAALPALGTWAPGAPIGVPSAPAAAPPLQPQQQQPQPQQQQQPARWGAEAPSGVPSAHAGLPSGPTGHHPPAGMHSPGVSSNSTGGLVTQHHRNISQQSFTATNWANLHQLASCSDTSSANHSRTASFDSAAAFAAAGGAAAAAAQQGAGALSPAGSPRPVHAGSATAGAGGVPGKGPIKLPAGDSTPSKGSKKEVLPPGGGWMRGIGSLLGAKQTKVAKLGLENDFYYCEQRKKWVLRGQEDADDQQAVIGPPPTAFSSSNLAGMQGANGSSGPPSSSAGTAGGFGTSSVGAAGPPSTPPRGVPAGSTSDIGGAAGPTLTSLITPGPPGSRAGPPGSTAAEMGSGSGPPSGNSVTHSSSSFLSRPRTGSVSSRYVQSAGLGGQHSSSGPLSGVLPGALLPAAGLGHAGGTPPPPAAAAALATSFVPSASTQEAHTAGASAATGAAAHHASFNAAGSHSGEGAAAAAPHQADGRLTDGASAPEISVTALPASMAAGAKQAAVETRDVFAAAPALALQQQQQPTEFSATGHAEAVQVMSDTLQHTDSQPAVCAGPGGYWDPTRAPATGPQQQAMQTVPTAQAAITHSSTADACAGANATGEATRHGSMVAVSQVPAGTVHGHTPSGGPPGSEQYAQAPQQQPQVQHLQQHDTSAGLATTQAAQQQQVRHQIEHAAGGGGASTQAGARSVPTSVPDVQEQWTQQMQYAATGQVSAGDQWQHSQPTDPDFTMHATTTTASHPASFTAPPAHPQQQHQQPHVAGTSEYIGSAHQQHPSHAHTYDFSQAHLYGQQYGQQQQLQYGQQYGQQYTHDANLQQFHQVDSTQQLPGQYNQHAPQQYAAYHPSQVGMNTQYALQY